MADRLTEQRELRTIFLNLEYAQRQRDWAVVDRATQRLANHLYGAEAEEWLV